MNQQSIEKGTSSAFRLIFDKKSGTLVPVQSAHREQQTAQELSNVEIKLESELIENHKNQMVTSQQIQNIKTQPQLQDEYAYFYNLRLLFKQNRLFCFHEILTGNTLKQLLKKIGLSCLIVQGQSIMEKLVSFFLHFTTFDCMPLCLRPFFAGMFFPLLLLCYLNFQFLSLKITIMSDYKIYQQITYLSCCFMTFLLMIITAFRGSGSLKSRCQKDFSGQLLKSKQIEKTQKQFCEQCQVIKSYRSLHCPICKQCIPKFSKHSLFLNQCIGASNELLYMLLMMSIIITQGIALAIFLAPRQRYLKSYFITNCIYYFLNNYIQWLAVVEFSETLLYNFIYNCTQFQIKTWQSKIYLTDSGKFVNSFDTGFIRNFKQSVYALFGLESKSFQLKDCLCDSQDPQTQGRTINWAKVIIYKKQQINKKCNQQRTIEMTTISNNFVDTVQDTKKQLEISRELQDTDHLKDTTLTKDN